MQHRFYHSSNAIVLYISFGNIRKKVNSQYENSNMRFKFFIWIFEILFFSHLITSSCFQGTFKYNSFKKYIIKCCEAGEVL